MPRTGRGGARQGQPGQTYSNRTDLNTNRAQPIKTAPSEAYGQRAAQEASQQAIPLPENTALPARAPSPGPQPGSLGAFDRPTERPGEPLTTGLVAGAGAGPEALPSYANDGDVGMQLRALYANFPNADLRDLIQAFDDNRQAFGG